MKTFALALMVCAAGAFTAVQAQPSGYPSSGAGACQGSKCLMPSPMPGRAVIGPSDRRTTSPFSSPNPAVIGPTDDPRPGIRTMPGDGPMPGGLIQGVDGI
jgi:hypothetical protein